jgi:hypothetical protein
MTREEITLLQEPAMRVAMEENLERDPVRIALDKRLPHAAAVASQVKYLQRARRKLPSYYDARCIIPSLAFEQSSGEQAAAHKEFEGNLCIDLTCGLGVDSLYLSRKFTKVISVERDETLAEVARINFGRLGAGNITVAHSSAEEFIAQFTPNNATPDGAKADLIYIDPDRRSADGRKLVRLEDCSPDVVALMPLLRKSAARIVIKTSPLFDIDEAFRLFGPHCRVDVVSAGGECKEVLIELSDDITSPCVRASAIGNGSVEYPLHREPAPIRPFTPPYRYMAIPDVALRKARLTAARFGEIAPDAYASSNDGYIFMNNLPATLPAVSGRFFEIIGMEHYSPKQLRKQLKSRNISSAELHLHNFPASAAQICRETGIKEGNGTLLAFTAAAANLWMIEIKEVSLR